MKPIFFIVPGILLLIGLFQMIAFIGIFLLGAVVSGFVILGSKKFLETHTITPKNTHKKEVSPFKETSQYTDPSNIKSRMEKATQRQRRPF